MAFGFLKRGANFALQTNPLTAPFALGRKIKPIREIQNVAIPALASTAGPLGSAGASAGLRGFDATLGAENVAGQGGNDINDEEALRTFGRQQLSGQIDPLAANALSGALSRRFNELRQVQGADFARRGLRRSTIAGSALGRTTDLERRALTDTFARQQFAQQSRGANILGGFQQQDLAQSQQSAQILGSIAQLAGIVSVPLIEDFLSRRKASQPQQQGGTR